MTIVIAWLVTAVLVGVAADIRGRRFRTWCLLALVLSPLLAFGILVLLRDLRTDPIPEDRRNSAGRAAPPDLDDVRNDEL